jgi:maltose alpha-D-glucosyltransferase/alpha-amylase
MSSNTTLNVGESLCSSRAIRRVRRGINPELEMGRFLTDVARFR